MQEVRFTPTKAWAIRLKALTEAGSRGEWSAVAELYVLGDTRL
jgi:hypothetical protein